MRIETSLTEFRAASEQNIKKGAEAFTVIFDGVRAQSPNRCPRVTFGMIEGIASAEGLTERQEKSIQQARAAIPELRV